MEQATRALAASISRCRIPSDMNSNGWTATSRPWPASWRPTGASPADGEHAATSPTRSSHSSEKAIPIPPPRSVAARAGVSLRLVFHHFADMDDLYHFVAALQLRRQWSDMPRLSSRLSLASRIERTVAHRAALFEEISPVRRALACRAPSSPAIAQAIAAADNLLLEGLRTTFAPEISELAPAAPGRVPGLRSTPRPRGRSGSGCGILRVSACARRAG